MGGAKVKRRLAPRAGLLDSNRPGVQAGGTQLAEINDHGPTPWFRRYPPICLSHACPGLALELEHREVCCLPASLKIFGSSPLTLLTRRPGGAIQKSLRCVVKRACTSGGGENHGEHYFLKRKRKKKNHGEDRASSGLAEEVHCQTGICRVCGARRREIRQENLS
jgi:hypothetical protein